MNWPADFPNKHGSFMSGSGNLANMTTALTDNTNMGGVVVALSKFKDRVTGDNLWM